ncbi:hypothetical protein ATX39_09680 [Oenococcus oeni]|nr:hypothetical protein ATX39_09680 [Oenococcus oeni]
MLIRSTKKAELYHRSELIEGVHHVSNLLAFLYAMDHEPETLARGFALADAIFEILPRIEGETYRPQLPAIAFHHMAQRAMECVIARERHTERPYRDLLARMYPNEAKRLEARSQSQNSNAFRDLG